MKNLTRKTVLLLGLVAGLLLVACGAPPMPDAPAVVGGEGDGETAVSATLADPAPQPTPELQMPTNPLPDHSLYRDQSTGLLLQYPTSWTQFNEPFLFFASNPDLVNGLRPEVNGALFVVIPRGTTILEVTTLSNFLDSFIEEFGAVGEPLEVLTPITETTINGADVVLTTVRGFNGFNDEYIVTYAAVTKPGRLYGIVSAVRPEEEAELLPVLETILNNIELTELPLATEEEGGAIPTIVPTLIAIDFSDPLSVTNAIFEAAQKRNFTQMASLCDPVGENSPSSAAFCDAANTPNRAEALVRSFANGRVNGEVAIEGNIAEVPVLIGFEGDVASVVRLVLRDGQWYLLDL